MNTLSIFSIYNVLFLLHTEKLKKFKFTGKVYFQVTWLFVYMNIFMNVGIKTYYFQWWFNKPLYWTYAYCQIKPTIYPTTQYIKEKLILMINIVKRQFYMNISCYCTIWAFWTKSWQNLIKGCLNRKHVLKARDCVLLQRDL